MRKAFLRQIPISHTWLSLDRSRELKVVSDLLDQNPRIVELVQQDLVADQKAVGAEGMAAEQILRALVVKQVNGLSFRQLAFFLADSQTFSTFCRLGFGQAPSKSALAANIKRLRFETLDQLNHVILGMAIEQGIENGSTVRCDCTVTETNIHPPSDSSLLVDGIRVLNHRVRLARELLGDSTEFVDELRRAKRCGRHIATSRKGEERTDLYQELFELTRKSLEMARNAIPALDAQEAKLKKRALRLRRQIILFLPRVEQVLDQAQRRILREEKVPSEEKIVSLFEPHTDIVIKNWKDVFYGHKVCLATGKSSMVLASWVLKGNPCDSTLAKTAIEKTRDNLGGRIPRQVVFDGSFKSRQNLTDLKELKVEDVVFTKHQGLKVEEMAKSPEAFEALRCFRAGIEGCISFLKRTFGWARCTWRSMPSFQAYIAAAALTYNLLLLARAMLR
jgi:IS5 family transposase